MNSVSSIWDWTRRTLLPGLHPGPLYDGLQSEPYIADRMSLHLGVARLRQVRVQKGTIPFWSITTSTSSHTYCLSATQVVFTLQYISLRITCYKTFKQIKKFKSFWLKRSDDVSTLACRQYLLKTRQDKILFTQFTQFTQNKQ